MTNSPSNQVIEVCCALGIRAEPVSLFWDEIFPKIALRFLTRYRDNGWIWEMMRGEASSASPDAWRLIEWLQIEGTFLMFFPRGEDSQVLQIESAAKISDILSECDNFEFYLTNINAEYLVCLNHHDVLIVAGRYEEHFKEIRRRIVLRD